MLLQRLYKEVNNFMRVLNFAKRNFKEIVRDPLSLIFAIILPLFLLFIFQQINIIEINTDIKIANKIYGVNGNFKIKAKAKNKIFCINIIGIIDSIYPNIQSTDFIGLMPNLINNDVDLSLATKVAVNNVIKEKPNITMPGVKFSIL